MNIRARLIMTALTVVLSLLALAHAQAPAPEAMPVTVDNFARAKSDVYFSATVKNGGFGTFTHRRAPASIDKQDVIRMNRDTLYSSAVFDLDAGAVTITLPETNTRYMSMLVINEDHYAQAFYYAPGTYTLDRHSIGTRYVLMVVRTLVDPNDPKDVKKVHVLQDAITSTQQNPGHFDVPQWDQASQKQMREALLVLGSTIPDYKGAFGTKEDVDPVRHLVGTALGWGGNPEKESIYLNVSPAKNDGKTAYRLRATNVPVDGFWSVSVYNAQGVFEQNPFNAYSVNNITGTKTADGAIDIQFGGCDGTMPNCLPVTPGRNYTVRLYRPRAELLNGTWTFPEAQPQ